MSFDLAVLAMGPDADPEAAWAMLGRCQGTHVDGDPDERIVGFYEALRADYPDDAGDSDQWGPWMCRPLDVGIDHVVMHLSWSSEDAMIDRIIELATEYRLVLLDFQGPRAYLPHR